jgi:FAD/FMN-containing dehydrogenase
MTLQERLADIVGAANVLTAPQDTKPYFTDWRRQYSAAAECVVRPASTQEVSQVVAVCAQEDVAIVPQGGNTGLVGGSVPTGARRELVLALGRMNRIRAFDVLNDTVTVEAGCVLSAVQRAADEAGHLFLSLATEAAARSGQSFDQPWQRSSCATAARASWCSAWKSCCPTAGSGMLRGLRRTIPAMT